MSQVIQNLGSFMLVALSAMFVQNTIFARGLGVSRLVKLVSDSAVDSVLFVSLLCLIQVISAPMAYLANQLLGQSQYWFRDYVRPLVLVACAVGAFVLVLIIVLIVRPVNMRDIFSVLPTATFNCAVLGPLMVTATQNFSFVQTMGFALGSGLGYGFAVLLVSEGQRKMSSRSVPSPFRGLPINLLYIGILAMAIYGLTGHRVAI